MPFSCSKTFAAFFMTTGLMALSACTQREPQDLKFPSNDRPCSEEEYNPQIPLPTRIESFLRKLEIVTTQNFPLGSCETLQKPLVDELFQVTFDNFDPMYAYFKVHDDLEKRVSTFPVDIQKDYRARKKVFIKALQDTFFSNSTSFTSKCLVREKLEKTYYDFIGGFLRQHTSFFVNNLPSYGNSREKVPPAEALVFWLVYHRQNAHETIYPFPYIQLPYLTVLPTSDPQSFVILVSQGCCMNLEVYPYFYRKGHISLIPIQGLVNYPGGETLPYFDVPDGLERDGDSPFYIWDKTHNILTVAHDRTTLEKIHYQFDHSTQLFKRVDGA